jgi:hypothetical protein
LAGGYSAQYYGVDVAYHYPESGKVFAAWLTSVELPTLPLPDAVVISKPDVHDPGGVVRKIIADNHYVEVAHFQGFTVWTHAAPGILRPGT